MYINFSSLCSVLKIMKTVLKISFILKGGDVTKEVKEI